MHETDIAFLFIGGAHQVYHLAPVAAALSRERPDLAITCLCADAESEAALDDVRRAMAAPDLRVQRIAPPRIATFATRLLRRRAAGKGPILAKLRIGLRRARAIVVPERTSAALRWMGWRKPLIHFRHGAGDRAPRSERRLAAFDLIVVAGEKDVARAVEVRKVDAARVRAAGYVKLDYLSRRPPPPGLFSGERPVVVYNPHFDASASSWPIAAEVVRRFAAQDRFDLVFAPHIRLSEDMTAAEAAAWRAMAVPGRIIVDLDSPRLIDMTYLVAADIYLGDMSSQLYEFLVQPRPAVFLNAHGADWRRDSRHAGWHLGVVADGVDDMLAAIERAIAGHDAVAARQAQAVRTAFGDYRGASERGARIIAEAVAG